MPKKSLYNKQFNYPQPFIRWETQRGCFYRCNFCQHREPNNALLPGKRCIPLSRTVAEIEWIHSNKVIQDIAVLDPVFNSGVYYLSHLNNLVGYTGNVLFILCYFFRVRVRFIVAPQKVKDSVKKVAGSVKKITI